MQVFAGLKRLAEEDVTNATLEVSIQFTPYEGLSRV